MNSPPDPGSPSPSTPSSGSPPPDDVQYAPQPSSAAAHVAHLASQLSSFVGASPSKRRLPGGSAFGAAANTRDAKSRRREDSRRLGSGGGSASMGGSGSGWADGKEGGKRDKDDLVDVSLVEHLRKEIGDPFQESAIRNAS